VATAPLGCVATELLDTPVALGSPAAGQRDEHRAHARRAARPRGRGRGAGHGDGRTVDVGEANGVLFYETASVGMNAAMFREAQHFDEGDYGSPLRAMWVALRYRPARMRSRPTGNGQDTRH
jgi:hypothetical protein